MPDDNPLTEYVSFRISTHLDHRYANVDAQGCSRLVSQAEKFVEDHPTSVLSANVDAKSLLELGIRYIFS